MAVAVPTVATVEVVGEYASFTKEEEEEEEEERERERSMERKELERQRERFHG